jgi:hypothetical protein
MAERPFFMKGRFVLPAAAVGGYLVWRWRSKEPTRPLQESTTTTVAEESAAEGAPVPTPRVRGAPGKEEAPPTPANTPVLDARRVVDKGRLTLGKRD